MKNKNCQHCGSYIKISLRNGIEIAKRITIGCTTYGYVHESCDKDFRERIEKNTKHFTFTRLIEKHN